MESSQLPPDKAVHRSTHHLTFTDCLLRECVHLFVCVCVRACTEMNVCFEKGTEFLVDFLSFFMFVLFNFLWILKMYSCEEGCARVHV